ncbi:MAG: hypothetical protein R2880_17590 [Deinococcales bacterium]
MARQADQSGLAPEIVIASQVYDWTVVLKDILANIAEGKLGGRSLCY